MSATFAEPLRHSQPLPMPAQTRFPALLNCQRQRVRDALAGIQPKLVVNKPGDAFEQEADRIAGQIVHMETPLAPQTRPAPASPSSPDLQREQDTPQEEEEAVQLKELPGEASEASTLLMDARALVRAALTSPGYPLDPQTRAFMEPRFGYNFGRVRVHTDVSAQESAKSLQAKAYTCGHNVVFGADQYHPGSIEGRRLLAHELAHVVQQDGPQGVSSGVQRMAQVDPRVSIDTHLVKSGVSGFKRHRNVYYHPGQSCPSLESQILTDLLRSPRVFEVSGGTNPEVVANLRAHIRARKGILDFAAQKKYTFGAGTSFRMNPNYFSVDTAAGKWKVKPGVDALEAARDVNVNPSQYALACLAATQITMVAGSGGAALTKDRSSDGDDWVPGDWGYIVNLAFSGQVGQEGENIIYAGHQKFWGHIEAANTYHTLKEWIARVARWGTPQLTDTRFRPRTGLRS